MRKIKNKSFDVPILFIIFRRRNESLKVIDAISKIRPQRLYVSQDGPRDKKEKEEIEETRKAVLSKINWKCKLTVWVHDKNLGLKKHIPEAFDKFFSNEEYGIYLEDDTIPSKEFFYFQKELLEKYKNDSRIFSVNGTNFYPQLVKPNESYYLSEIGDIWGFGLWRRSWKLYDPNLSDFSKVSDTPEYNSYFFNPRYKFYLESFWKAIISKKIDSWAMQIVYAAVKNNMYFISPKVNMVNNIGANKSGSNISLQTYFQEFGSPFPLRHPKKMIYDKRNDIKYFQNMLTGGWPRLLLIKFYLSASAKLKVALNKFVGVLTVDG